MADPYNVIRLSGTFSGGEVWSINPKFMGDFGSLATTFTDLQAWAANVAALNAGNILPSTMRGQLSSLATMTSIRAEYYNGLGKLDQVAEHVLLTPILGTATASKPYQTSIVLSLRSGRPGRSYRGRLYLPALAATFEAGSARLTNAAVTTLATEAAGWLAALASAAPAGVSVDPAIVSQTLGTSTPITSVQVGDILDTQRRRRDSMQEAYATATVPAG